MMRAPLLLIFCLSVARSFSTARPISNFHILSLAQTGEGLGENRETRQPANKNHFRLTATLLASANPLRAEASSSPAASSPAIEQDDLLVKKKRNALVEKIKSLVNNVKTAPFALSLVTFILGYRLGSRITASSVVSTGAATATTARAAARRYPIIATILLVVAIRDAWSLVPTWVKKNITIADKKHGTRSIPTSDDPDDLTSFSALSRKLSTLYQRGKEKLSSSGEEIGSPGIVFLALLQITSQIKQQVARGRDDLYEGSGMVLAEPGEVLEGMDEYFEYADWAYDELPEGQSLKGNLKEKGYSLLRHEKTVLPGQVAHFVAVSTERKEALIGVKGTSGFEDMLTDCCGNAVRHQFKDGPFIQSGRDEISCHEGILLSSRRLADDLLTFVQDVLLPAGYRKITVTGHSLGAGVAVIFAMILRSKIKELRTSDKIRVLAFASPPILDYEASKDCESFVTTFVNNSDIIPRCSLSNLVLLLEFMRVVNRRLDEEGMSPRDMKSTAAFAKWLRQGKHGEMILRPKEIQKSMDLALESLDINDPDHLYVAGRVVHMFDEWSKEGYGNKSDYENATEESKEVPTAEKVYVADGATKALRVIEIDDRMLSDHMSPGYRASIQSLLAKPEKKFWKTITTTQ